MVPQALQQKSANFFCKGPSSTHFRLCGPFSLCCNYSALSFYHRQCANKQVWLCSNKTPFTKRGWIWRLSQPLASRIPFRCLGLTFKTLCHLTSACTPPIPVLLSLRRHNGLQKVLILWLCCFCTWNTFSSVLTFPTGQISMPYLSLSSHQLLQVEATPPSVLHTSVFMPLMSSLPYGYFPAGQEGASALIPLSTQLGARLGEGH